MDKNSNFTLSNGVAIPCIGLGTWRTPNDESASAAIKAAVEAGYRHIDGAKIYKNEAAVGAAIRNCGVSREKLFITNKVWNAERGYETTLKAIDNSLEAMGLDYFDLYLIHWPATATNYADWGEINRGTWQAMTETYRAGKLKAIGVSNFLEHHLKALMEMEVKPMVNQIEYHPGLRQQAIVDYCRANDILVEGYSPLGHGELLANAGLQKLADRYGKSTAQICLRWEMQNGILPLPKSVNAVRIQENINVFDFTLSAEDMAYIDQMETGCRVATDPDEMKP